MRTASVAILAACMAIGAAALPQQAHLALTRSVDELRLVWVSTVKGGEPTIRYKQPGSAERTVSGTWSTYTIDQLCAAPANEAANFEDPGQINVATMTGLAPGESVWFEYGTSADGYANSTAVVGLRPGATSANIVVLADMGRASASTDQLIHEVDNTTVVVSLARARAFASCLSRRCRPRRRHGGKARQRQRFVCHCVPAALPGRPLVRDGAQGPVG